MTKKNKIGISKETKWAVAIIILLHTVGLFGLSSNYSSLFIMLTPVNLLVSVAMVIWAGPTVNSGFKMWFLGTFLFGFLVEWFGISTGLLFGDYSYGNSLGFKIAGVPFIIGLNWIIVTYGSYSLAALIPFSKWVRIILASLFCDFIDVFIEPAAIALDYWSWDAGMPPIRNFIGWFLVAFVLQWWSYDGNSRPIQKNMVAAILFVVQILFFVLLNLFVL